MNRTMLRETPGLGHVQALEIEIERLRAEQEILVRNIASDAEFMDIPVRVIDQHCFDGDGPTVIGTTWHVLTQYSERDDYTRHFGHAADSCDGAGWCDRLETPQPNKHWRAGRRYLHTFHGTHVLVGLLPREDNNHFKGSLACVLIPTHS